MGYACPVCAAPQADGEHLANHLAFSALLGHDDHADWLDEHAPDWSEADPDALFEAVEPHVEATEFPQVFEDTTGERPDVDVPAGGEHDHAHRPPTGPAGSADLDETAADALEEARRLTRERRDGDGEDAA